MLAARVSGWTAVEVAGEPVKRMPTAQEKAAMGAAAAGASCWVQRQELQVVRPRRQHR